MKTTIDVTDKREAALVRQALADPETRVCVNVLGALLTLPSAQARARVLMFVSSRLAEDDVPKDAAGFPVPGKAAPVEPALTLLR